MPKKRGSRGGGGHAPKGGAPPPPGSSRTHGQEPKVAKHSITGKQYIWIYRWNTQICAWVVVNTMHKAYKGHKLFRNRPPNADLRKFKAWVDAGMGGTIRGVGGQKRTLSNSLQDS